MGLGARLELPIRDVEPLRVEFLVIAAVMGGEAGQLERNGCAPVRPYVRMLGAVHARVGPPARCVAGFVVFATGPMPLGDPRPVVENASSGAGSCR
jgi:hypothetical protein